MRWPLILLFFLPVNAHAQVRVKLNYNKHWELTTPDSVVYIRMAIYDTTNFVFAGPVTDLYRSGKPQMKGEYKFGKKDGMFTFYYENGNIESTGIFINDERAGTWKYFYEDGAPRAEADFKKVGTEDQAIVFLNDSTGRPILQNGNGDWIETLDVYRQSPMTITGQFVDYRRDGKWLVRLNNGKKIIEEVYRNGKFVSGNGFNHFLTGGRYAIDKPNIATLPLPYKIIITEEFRAVQEVNFTTYPALRMIRYDEKVVRKNQREDLLQVAVVGSSTGNSGFDFYDVVEEPPAPKDGLAAVMNYINSNLRYPPEARKQGISGSVLIGFIVEKDGTLTEINVVKKIGGGCDEEALRVLTDYASKNTWQPGKQKGKPVRTRMIMPVSFRLG